MNYTQTLKELYSLHKFGIKLGLEKMQLILYELGNFHKKIKFIHVAGSNGKGSAAAMIASILKQAGYKTGLYTSPHLVGLNERIRIDDKEISNEEIVKFYSKIKKLRKKYKCTFFETVTTLALLYFYEKKVDYVVLEVGLGGRLDATNIVTPLVSVITTISLEHQEYLGHTIEKIAAEKAGIIKKNVPVVTATTGKAFEVIKEAAKQKNSKLHKVKIRKIKTNLKGEFQQFNASVALETINVLKQKGLNISKKAIDKGFMSIDWQGRYDFKNSKLILDCAHNPAGAHVLANELKRLNKKVILVFGVMSDKDIKGMITKLAKVSSKIILTKADVKRAAPIKLISPYVKTYISIPGVKKAVAYAKSIAKKNEVVVLTGSCYVVGEYLE